MYVARTSHGNCGLIDWSLPPILSLEVLGRTRDLGPPPAAWAVAAPSQSHVFNAPLISSHFVAGARRVAEALSADIVVGERDPALTPSGQVRSVIERSRQRGTW